MPQTSLRDSAYVNTRNQPEIGFFPNFMLRTLILQPPNTHLFHLTVKTWKAIQFPILPWLPGNSQLHELLSGNHCRTSL